MYIKAVMLPQIVAPPTPPSPRQRQEYGLQGSRRVLYSRSHDRSSAGATFRTMQYGPDKSCRRSHKRCHPRPKPARRRRLRKATSSSGGRPSSGRCSTPGTGRSPLGGLPPGAVATLDCANWGRGSRGNQAAPAAASAVDDNGGVVRTADQVQVPLKSDA